jgi:hypothetical protein
MEMTIQIICAKPHDLTTKLASEIMQSLNEIRSLLEIKIIKRRHNLCLKIIIENNIN